MKFKLNRALTNRLNTITDSSWPQDYQLEYMKVGILFVFIIKFTQTLKAIKSACMDKFNLSFYEMISDLKSNKTTSCNPWQLYNKNNMNLKVRWNAAL